MAAGIIPRPGTSVGPCDAKATCGHIDCMNNVQDAESSCCLCGKRIGYDVLCYYVHGNDTSPSAIKPFMPADAFEATPLRNASGAPLCIVHEECVVIRIEATKE